MHGQKNDNMQDGTIFSKHPNNPELNSPPEGIPNTKFTKFNTKTSLYSIV